MQINLANISEDLNIGISVKKGNTRATDKMCEEGWQQDFDVTDGQCFC